MRWIIALFLLVLAMPAHAQVSGRAPVMDLAHYTCADVADNGVDRGRVISQWAARSNSDGTYSCHGEDDPQRTLFNAHIWHFLSKTYGGTISLIKDLTKAECDGLAAQFPVEDGMKAVEGFAPDGTAGNRPVYRPGAIEMAECFQ